MPVGLPPIDEHLPSDLSAWVSERRAILTSPAQETAEGGLWSVALVEVVVDTLGRAEPSSVAIVASSNQGFDPPARDYVLHALFRPARVHGRAVRVPLRLPIDFAIVTAR